MLGLLSFIPILGPIIDGIVSIWAKTKDTEVAKYKVDGEVRTVEVQASTATTIAFKDDIGVKITRDIILFPVAVWTCLIVWDKIVEIRYPGAVWGVMPLTDASGLAFLPYAVMTFLFGLAAMNTWKRS